MALVEVMGVKVELQTAINQLAGELYRGKAENDRLVEPQKNKSDNEPIPTISLEQLKEVFHKLSVELSSLTNLVPTKMYHREISLFDLGGKVLKSLFGTLDSEDLSLLQESKEYYGDLWASFNFDGLQKWVQDFKQSEHSLEINSDMENFKTLIKEGETLLNAKNKIPTVFKIEENWYIPKVVNEPVESRPLTSITHLESLEKGSGDSEQEASKPLSDDDEVASPPQSKLWSQDKFLKEYRKFNLDLAPKLLFARGSLVELLISSNIARYAEFRSVTRVLTWLEDRLELVPCSRADVFSTHHISVVEKRMLMKLMATCVEPGSSDKEFEEKFPDASILGKFLLYVLVQSFHEIVSVKDRSRSSRPSVLTPELTKHVQQTLQHFPEYADKTFVEYLKSKKLTSNLVHYVLYAIAMATDKTPCLEGVARTQRFLNSLGRYGNTPFLWPMYGSGELPQCFCRLCAVFGGLYHLKRTADALIIKTDEGSKSQCVSIVSGNQRLDTANVIFGVGHALPQFLKNVPTQGISRGIFITDRSILPSEKEALTLLQFPPVGGVGEPVTIIEVGPSTNACPAGLYVVHMTCKQQTSAKEDLQPVVAKLFSTDGDNHHQTRVPADTPTTHTQVGSSGEEGELEKTSIVEQDLVKPQVLWCLYFNCLDTSSTDLSSNTPAKVYLCSGPELDLDFEFAVQQAKDIFGKMYPDLEFLPRAPDPEDIVLEGEEENDGADTDSKPENVSAEESRLHSTFAEDPDIMGASWSTCRDVQNLHIQPRNNLEVYCIFITCSGYTPMY
uniref:RAE1/2 domain-containing protein n=1 Tax=Timema monikensis TaxID=170555 RepID=A0A7R9E1Q6_9NEOP|nr:unnamed protein product [Timema monikensis]